MTPTPHKRPPNTHKTLLQTTPTRPSPNAVRILARVWSGEGHIMAWNGPFQEYTPIHPYLFTRIHTLFNACLTIRLQHLKTPPNKPQYPHNIPNTSNSSPPKKNSRKSLPIPKRQPKHTSNAPNTP